MTIHREQVDHTDVVWSTCREVRFEGFKNPLIINLLDPFPVGPPGFWAKQSLLMISYREMAALRGFFQTISLLKGVTPPFPRRFGAGDPLHKINMPFFFFLPILPS